MPEICGLVLAPLKAGLHLVNAGHAGRAVPSGRRSSARRSSRRAAVSRAGAWPRRPPRTSGRGYPSHRRGRRLRSSSSRHSCHRSSGCTMPTRVASRGRAPASRRAAIKISAGVRTLTTTAWAQAVLDDHRGGRLSSEVRGSPPNSNARRRALRNGAHREVECPELRLEYPSRTCSYRWEVGHAVTSVPRLRHLVMTAAGFPGLAAR